MRPGAGSPHITSTQKAQPQKTQDHISSAEQTEKEPSLGELICFPWAGLLYSTAD
jgi:hypothetical protein